MNQTKIVLPVAVLDIPHWRVNFQPDEYTKELIPSLSECIKIIEKTKVSLRGWDYPHLSYRNEERARGINWIASWNDSMELREYWRFYQSGQFLHLFAVPEALDNEWQEQLKKSARRFLNIANAEKVPGFFSMVNFIYTMTEIFEFSARLCQAGVYKGQLDISVEIKNIQGFVLSTDRGRMLSGCYSASEENLGKTWSFESDILVANSSGCSLNAIIWFFERFGWLPPPEEVIRRDQEKLLKKLI